MGGARQTTGDSRTRYARVEWFLGRESAIRTANAGQAAQHFDRVPTYVPLPALRRTHRGERAGEYPPALSKAPSIG